MFSNCILNLAFLIIGVKESSFLNVIFTAVNILIIIFVFICGSIKSDPVNWNQYVYVIF